MKKILFKQNVKVKKADLVVGIPTLNEADSIRFVVEQVDKGLQKYFPGVNAVIINVDNNSPDGTKKVFKNTETQTPKEYISTPADLVGKGRNFYNLFKRIQELKAKAVIVVDADLISITPEWVKNLGEPVFKNGYDYITPIYARHEYDGSITNHIVYPLMYGLLGQNIRQPIGGDFSMSAGLIKHLMKQRWIKTTKEYGIDIFLTSNAVFGKFKIGQTCLGAKIHKPSAPKLGPMFVQVVTTYFSNLIKYKEDWHRGLGIKKIPIFNKKNNDKPQNLSIDFKEIKTTALYLFKINKINLKKYLSSEVYQELKQIYKSKQMDIKPELWCKIVYDMLYTFDTKKINGNFMQAFKPLYFGRAASFIKYTLEMDSKASEQKIVDQAKVFYKHRDYFLEKYRK